MQVFFSSYDMLNLVSSLAMSPIEAIGLEWSHGGETAAADTACSIQ